MFSVSTFFEFLFRAFKHSSPRQRTKQTSPHCSHQHSHCFHRRSQAHRAAGGSSGTGRAPGRQRSRGARHNLAEPRRNAPGQERGQDPDRGPLPPSLRVPAPSARPCGEEPGKAPAAAPGPTWCWHSRAEAAAGPGRAGPGRAGQPQGRVRSSPASARLPGRGCGTAATPRARHGPHGHGDPGTGTPGALGHRYPTGTGRARPAPRPPACPSSPPARPGPSCPPAATSSHLFNSR